ncbi:hypothetical protein [Weissella bombi]|uniref:hypothetical protein n=1 Tax=Weissella bombi TaxID=1505725 RepID=UPI003AF286DE
MVDVENVIKRIKRNTKLDDEELLNEIAQDAIDNATADGFTEPKLEIAAGWLGSHFASLITGANSNIKKQTLAVMSIEYQSNSGSSTYLIEYQRMLALLNGGPNQVEFI